MTDPPIRDIELGMRRYGSDSPPCSAKVRVRDEDFMVEEVLNLNGLSSSPKEGYYPLYLVRKKGMDTLHMERELAFALKSRVSFGGIKDKRADATQYATPTSRRADPVDEVQRKGFTAKLVGYLPKPVARGSVVGNRFKLVLRDCCPGIEASLAEVGRCAEGRHVPNFYGTQRFGSRAGSHIVGRAIVRGDFKEAVETILQSESLEYKAILESLSPGQDTEQRVARHLIRKPLDFIGALRSVPIKLRRLFVHAYQSYIFNLTLSLALERDLNISRYERGDNWCEPGGDGLTLGRPQGVGDQPADSAAPLIQLPGFAQRDYGSRFDALLGEVMSGEGVAGKEFYVKDMEEVSAEGGFRIPYLTVLNLKASYDGGNATVEFSLGRGQYATVLLREIIKQ